MSQATLENDVDYERMLLSHAELCHSVALTLTRDPRRAEELARDTLLWAWQGGRDWLDEAPLKMVLLRELRGRFLRDRRTLRPRWFFEAKQVLEVQA